MGTNPKLSKKINEVVSPYCNCQWCILKEIMLSKSTDPRFLIQLKCIEHFKWEESQTLKRDIGWKEANDKWIERGFATAFSKFYNEELTAEEIYAQILNFLTKN
ncbi:MAG: hypothetical protein PHW03_02595 [Eubacteriales bacterium]|nr:hypothetical protein [Eubacteriales bacterium]